MTRPLAVKAIPFFHSLFPQPQLQLDLGCHSRAAWAGCMAAQAVPRHPPDAGGKILLNNARLILKRGRRYGLCGANGGG